MSQVATAQSSNCPAGSTYTLGICLVTTPSQAQPEAQTTGSTYRTTSYQAQPEASGEAEGASYGSGDKVIPFPLVLICQNINLSLFIAKLTPSFGVQLTYKPVKPVITTR